MQKLSQARILGYTIGDLGINLNFQMIGFYLAYFYTDVFKISAAHVGGLFLAARLWDAINDPIMGFIADHTKSRWGKFRPYILFGAVPLNLILILLYTTPDFGYNAKVVYAYVTYILHGMVFTAVGLPYSSISAVMTQDQQERSVISTYRMFFAVVVAISLIIGPGVPWFVQKLISMGYTEQQGYSYAAIILGMSSTILLWIAYYFSQERVQIPQEKYHLKDMLPILFNNRELLILAVAMFLNTAVWVIINASIIYYFKYILVNQDLLSVFHLMMLPATALGAVITPFITKVIGKHKAFIIGSAVVSGILVVRYFIPGELGYWYIFLGVSMIFAIAQMMCSITQWGMLPDCVEYGHYKSGFRSEGIPFAFFSFMQKAGMALAGAFASYVLAYVKYDPDAEITTAVLSAIRFLFNLAPAIASVLCLVALLFYRLDREFFDQIMAKLEKGETERTSK